MLDHEDDIEVVAEAGTGVEAVELTHKHRPDVVPMDIRMPEIDGLEATASLIEDSDGEVTVLSRRDRMW